MTATRTQKTAIDQRLILELSIDAQGEVTRKPSQLGRKDTLEGKLLAEIYPGIQVARVSVPHELTPYEQSVVENRMAKLIYGGVEYRLVGASNSAKDGKFYFVDLAHSKQIAERFQHWPEAAMVYFAILVSDCKLMVDETNFRVAVVQEHALGTNDCRGWVRESVYRKLKIGTNRFCQFRLAFDAHEPKQWQLKDINLTTGQSTQLNLQAGGSIGFNYHLGTHTSIFEFGAQVRNAHKGQYASQPTYDNFSANATPPMMTQFVTPFKNPSFYGGSYQLGPITSFELIQKWLEQNPGALPLDVSATHLNSDPGDYNLQERITAGYLMNTIDFNSKFHLQTGLRIEATNEANTGYEVINDANGNWVSTQAVNGGGSYIDFMPSVQFRYNIDQNSDLRAVYSRGISRPDPYDLVPYQTLDESTTPNTENIGNPALKAELANNYDILYERYLPSVGMIEAGYFYKYLTNQLFQTISQVPNPFPNPITSTVYLNQWQNGSHAHVQGVELAYQQHLSYLPGVLSGLQIDANMTYTESQSFGVPERTDVPQLVGQAPWSFNVNPAYETKRLMVGMGISFDGPNISAYQWQNEGPNAVQGPVNGPFGDNYYFQRAQVDSQASYYLGHGFTVTASGENMNNAPLGFYNGSKYHMTQKEYYKPIYYGGIRWELHGKGKD